MSDKDTGFPNLITGKSFLKHNETVETNLEVIENNNLTILVSSILLQKDTRIRYLHHL